MDPTNFGWMQKDDKLIPVLAEKPPAPSSLLELIRCNCKTDCNTRRCRCRKHGLECTPMCGQCKGTSCPNSPQMDEDEEEDEED